MGCELVACVVASIIVVAALAAVNEIVLPMTFAAVLAVIFKPIAGVLTRHRINRRLPPDWSYSACWAW